MSVENQGQADYSAGTTYGSAYSGYSEVLAPQPALYNPSTAYYGHHGGGAAYSATPASASSKPASYYSAGAYAVTNPAPTTGESTMSYGYGSYSYAPQYVTVTPEQNVYTYSSPTVEQATVTGYTPTPQTVTAPDIQSDVTSEIAANPASYTPSYQTPALPSYAANSAADGSPPPGGSPSGGSSGGGSQPQQQQQKPSTTYIRNVINASGSGQPGGNSYGRLTGNYGTGSGTSTYSAQGNYTSNNIVPYLLIGGLVLLAYEAFKPKHHHG